MILGWVYFSLSKIMLHYAFGFCIGKSFSPTSHPPQHHFTLLPSSLNYRGLFALSEFWTHLDFLPWQSNEDFCIQCDFCYFNLKLFLFSLKTFLFLLKCHKMLFLKFICLNHIPFGLCFYLWSFLVASQSWIVFCLAVFRWLPPPSFLCLCRGGHRHYLWVNALSPLSGSLRQA